MMECLLSPGSIALAVAAFIFFMTLFLVSKQWIGIGMAVILLLFSLISGMIVSNQALIHEYISGPSDGHVRDVDTKVDHFQEHVLKAYDSLKADLEIQKHKLQSLTEEVQTLKKEQKPE